MEINLEDVDFITVISHKDEKKNIAQSDLNFYFLLRYLDEIHTLLCPDKIGSWQYRAEHCVKEAKRIAKERKKHAH